MDGSGSRPVWFAPKRPELRVDASQQYSVHFYFCTFLFVHYGRLVHTVHVYSVHVYYFYYVRFYYV